MQTSLVAGDTLAFDTAAPLDADGNTYRASDGWTMTYVLVPRSSAGAVITITASADGDDFTVAVPSTTTADWESGWYSWAGYVSKSGNRYTFGTGQIEIKADPATAAAGFDGRSTAEKILDQLRGLYETYSSGQGLVSEYEIAGRRMKFRSVVELLEQIRYWERVVADERRAARVASGQAAGGKILVRFGR